jgi:hypothetical protein
MSSDTSSLRSYPVLIVGGLLVIAARFHKYTLGPFAKDDPRREQLMYWCSSLVGATLATAAMVPHGWPATLAVGFITVWSTVLYRPGGINQRRRWER